MSTAKNSYANFCKENQVPLFLQYEWYQSLFGDDWDVVVAEVNGVVQGFLPFILTKKKSFKLIRPPYLTPYQGVIMAYPDGQKYANKLSHEKEVMDLIIDGIPNVDSFEQKFDPSFTNWLPFYWKGYEQTTQYTYIINDISKCDEVFAGFKENIRREIRKAEKQLTVEASSNIDALYNLKREVYSSRNQEYPIPQEILKKAFNYTNDKQCGELLFAKDEHGKVHSMLFYVWDDYCAYYVHGGTAEEYKRTGSMSLLLWEAIKRSSGRVKAFNFEGSMTESIERYFRAFGGEQVPYFKISKTDSKLLKLLKH